MSKTVLDRYDIPRPTGLGGWLASVRASLASPQRRREEISQLLWTPQPWQDEPSIAQTLVKIRLLVDQGLWDEPVVGDALAKRFQDRAHANELSNLGHDTLHMMKDGLPAAVLHMLLEAGVDPAYRERGNYSDTLLSAAVRNQAPEYVDLLIKAGAPLDVVDSCNCSPLRLVVRNAASATDDVQRAQSLALLGKLIKAGANPNFTARFAMASDPDDSPLPPTALMEAACLGWVEGMQLLIDAGATADQPNSPRSRPAVLEVANNFQPRRRDGTAILFQKNFEQVLDMLIAVGAKVAVVDDEGNSPLFQAVRTGEMGIALALLERGAKPDFIPGQCTLSHILCIGADFNDPQAHEFVSRMPSGFWSQKDDDGRTAFDILQGLKDEGHLRPFVDPWFSFVEAERLKEGFVSEPSPTTRSRVRL